MQNHNLIKEEYKNLHDSLKSSYPYLIKYHSLGIWAPSSIKNLYKIFKKFGTPYLSFIDLGSGDGLAVFTASQFFKEATGIEIDNEIFSKSAKINDKLNIENVNLIAGDYFEHNIENYDYVFMAPDKEFNLKIENKLAEELSGKLIVYSSIFRPKGLKKISEFKSGNFDVGIYEKFPK